MVVVVVVVATDDDIVVFVVVVTHDTVLAIIYQVDHVMCSYHSIVCSIILSVDL